MSSFEIVPNPYATWGWILSSAAYQKRKWSVIFLWCHNFRQKWALFCHLSLKKRVPFWAARCQKLGSSATIYTLQNPLKSFSKQNAILVQNTTGKLWNDIVRCRFSNARKKVIENQYFTYQVLNCTYFLNKYICQYLWSKISRFWFSIVLKSIQ